MHDRYVFDQPILSADILAFEHVHDGYHATKHTSVTPNPFSDAG